MEKGQPLSFLFYILIDVIILMLMSPGQMLLTHFICNVLSGCIDQMLLGQFYLFIIMACVVTELCGCQGVTKP